MRNVLLLVVLILFIRTTYSFSQEFAWSAKLEKIQSDGYYDIFINPEITAKLNYKFSDIRIYDEEGNEVPYIRRSETDQFQTAESQELKIIENEHRVTKKYTSVLVHNPYKQTLSNFVMIITQTDAEKWINLTGSDDLKSWSILKNNTRYQAEFSDSATSEIRITDIPASEYEYYKFLLYDYNTEAIQLNKVLNYKISDNAKEFTEVIKPSFSQDDIIEESRSIIHISFDEAQYIDKIKFFIDNPRHYLREAELTKKDSATGKKIRLEYYDEKQQDFYLCSDSLNELLLSKYNAKDLFLVIENNDDQPLIISNVKAYQQNEYFVAYLEKGIDYTIKFGNKNVTSPIYDLKFFANKIPQELPVIEVVGLTQLIGGEGEEGKAIYIKPVYLWLAFAVVIIVLGLISVRVFRSKDKEEEAPQSEITN